MGLREFLIRPGQALDRVATVIESQMPVGKRADGVVENNRGCGQNCKQQSLTDVGRPTPFNKCLLIPEALEASSNQQYRLKWHVAFWEEWSHPRKRNRISHLRSASCGSVWFFGTPLTTILTTVLLALPQKSFFLNGFDPLPIIRPFLFLGQMECPKVLHHPSPCESATSLYPQNLCFSPFFAFSEYAKSGI